MDLRLTMFAPLLASNKNICFHPIIYSLHKYVSEQAEHKSILKSADDSVIDSPLQDDETRHVPVLDHFDKWGPILHAAQLTF